MTNRVDPVKMAALLHAILPRRKHVGSKCGYQCCHIKRMKGGLQDMGPELNPSDRPR